MKDKKALLSTLWLFAVLNFLYCDVMSLMDAGVLKQYLSGTVNGIHMTGGFLLGAAVLMEISISMVLFSRILKYKANRIANMVAGIIVTLVQIGTLFAAPTAYYLFFSAIEITATVLIFLIAIRWHESGQVSGNA